MSENQQVGGGCFGCLSFVLMFVAVVALYNWSHGMVAQVAIAAAFGTLFSGVFYIAMFFIAVFVAILLLVGGRR